MPITRRDMVKGGALGGAAAMAVAGCAAQAPVNGVAGGGKLLHHVFFWLKNPGNAADRDQLIAGLRALAAIPVVRSLAVGRPASTEQRGVVDGSFDVSELMVFDSAADEKIYQDHPIHQDFVAKHQHLWARVQVYDVATL